MRRIFVRLWFAAVPLVFALGVPGDACAQAAGVTLKRSDILRRARLDTTIGNLRVARAGRIDTVATSAEQVTLRRGDVLVVPTARPPTYDSSAGATPHVDLPTQYVMLDRAGTTVLTLSVRFEPQGGGLRYDADARRFRGTVLIGLEDSTRRSEQVQLSPVEIEFTTDADEVTPQRVRIAHTNIPFVEVQVRALDPGDTVSLHIRPVFDPDGQHAPLPVVRPAITIDPSPARIQGFGLETTTLTVTLPPAVGAPPVAIALSADPGALDTTLLAIAAGGVGVTRLRSVGTGAAVVRARFGSVASGETSVMFVFPWPFLVAAVLGGAAGAVLRARRPRDKPGRLRLFPIDLLVGALTGVVVAAAYAVGVNVLGLTLSVRVGEAAVFVLAVVGGYRGAPGVLRERLSGAAGASTPS